MAKDEVCEIVEKITVNPVVNNILTVLFVAEIIAVPYVLHGEGADFELKMYIGCTIGMIGLIFVVKHGAIVVGQWISRTFLRGAPFNDPISKRKTAEKLGDQVWQLVIHVTMAAMEWAVLSDETWYADPEQVWVPLPPLQGKQKPLLHYLYVMQLAIWVGTCISHRWFEELHKDYYVMYIHHLMTIALLLGSWRCNFHRVGCLVLFVHDFSDIFGDWLKITNYFNLSGPWGLFTVEIAFASVLGSWFWYRLWIFPTSIIRACYSASIQYMNYFSNFDTILHWSMCLLLTLLFCLHVYWFAIFIRILLRIISGGSTHEAGRQEYEGASDSDAETSPPSDNTRRKRMVKGKHAD